MDQRGKKRKTKIFLESGEKLIYEFKRISYFVSITEFSVLVVVVVTLYMNE